MSDAYAISDRLNRDCDCVGTDVPTLQLALDSQLAQARGAAEPTMLTRYDGAAAVRHLFVVAAGLDSQVLGETEVLGLIASGLSDRELSDIIAYAKSLPPSDKVQPPTVIGPLGKMLIGFGVMPIDTETIDHTKAHVAVPPEATVSVEFGAHIASACVGCHRTTYNGGKIAQGPPDWPPARNLTPGGELAKWTEDDFVKTLRTGVRPLGERRPSELEHGPEITIANVRPEVAVTEELRVEDRLHQRPERETVIRADEVDGRAHERDANDLSRLE